MESKDRRQTAGAVPLGTVSPSVLNARKSLGLPRATKESKLGRKTGLISRPSLAGKLTATAGQPQRRSSTYGNSSGVKTDPRPVSDKVYQQKLVRTLIQFLTEHGYQHPISPKLLTSPMAKDVTAIAQFLHSQADPHFKKFTKLELDVPELFKNLRYPFGISKSALFAVGSPHTWPGLLAALLWLVELLSYQEKAEEARPETFDEKQAAEHDFYEYIEAAYKAFLSGDDAQAQELDDSKMQQFEERASSIDQESNQLQQGIEQIQAELQKLRSEPSPLNTATAKLTEYATDKEKLQRVIESLQGHKQSLQRKLQEHQGDLHSKQQQLAQVQQDCDEMRQRVAAQTVNRDDVIRMNSERSKQEEIRTSLAMQRETLERRVGDQELKLEQQLDALETIVQAYNSTADRLQLIPATAKRAEGAPFEAQVERTGAAASEIVSLDLKGAVKPALIRLRDTSANRARELSAEALALQERVDALGIAIAERMEENNGLQEQVEELEGSWRDKKGDLEEDMRSAREQVDGLKQDIAGVRGWGAQPLQDSHTAHHALQGHLEDVTRRTQAERVSLSSELEEAIEMICSHKFEIQEIIRKTVEEVRQHQAAFQAQQWDDLLEQPA